MLRATLIIVLAAGGVALAPATAPAATLTGRVLVSMQPQDGGPAHVSSDATLADTDAQRSGPAVPSIGLVTVRPRAGESTAALVTRLKQQPDVRAVQRERRAVPRALPDDPAFTTTETAAGTPPGVPVEWWASSENLPAAWSITHGSGARVAVVDTGVDATHPDLKGRIVRAENFDSVDDGGATVDENGHGTHVASLACARGGNGLGLVGAGYGCSLIVEKIDFTDSSIAAAIVDAAKHGADSINMSFGTDGSQQPTQSLVDALRYARSKGTVLVAAAADEDVTEQGDPANVLQPTGSGPHIREGLGLSVTAADYSGGRAWFGGRGSQVSIAASGGFFRTSGPRGLLGAMPAAQNQLETGDPGDPRFGIPATQACGCRTVLAGDRRYAYLAGTSMSSPQVAAVAAVMGHLNPGLRPADVERILKQTATRRAGWTSDVGWGLLNAGRAVKAARDTDRTAPKSSLTVVTRTTSGLVLNVAARDIAPGGARPSGVARVQLYRSQGGRRVLYRTVRPGRLALKVVAGTSLALTARAVDRAGNRQKLAATPQLRITR